MKTPLQSGDVLVVVDVQVDFVSGALAVPGAEHILPAVNRYLSEFRVRRLPVVATRDWHPANHVSFAARGGPWPAHCVAGTRGAEFAAGLDLPRDVHVVSKAATPDHDAYSAFQEPQIDPLLRRLGARRLFVCGLATEYCVLGTVRDALHRGYAVFLLVDAIRAVDVEPGDGVVAVRSMLALGAHPLRLEELEEVGAPHG